MSKFRHPTTNRRYTSQLFWDLQIELPVDDRLIEPLYTLHDDKEGFINFRKEYVRDMDPTGYKTSARLLENFDHFSLLMKNCAWFREAKVEWDKEIAAKAEAEAMDTLREIARGGEDIKTSERISAAKTIIGKSEKLKKEANPPRKPGRPTNEEVQGHLKEEARLSREEEEDLKRIRAVN